ncbi:MAG TPA: hypothetical protein VHS99_20380 [Chloroflexota bacterium]|nr:hypothetical protein [Chloroflexota bacterium]
MAAAVQTLALADASGARRLLEGLPRDAAQAVLRQHARQFPDASLTLIADLLERGASPMIQELAVEALAEVGTQGAADLAADWADASPETATREIRKAARRALLRLAQRGLRPAAPEAPAAPAVQEPREWVRRAFSSAVDWEGTRLLYLLVDLPMAGAHMIRALVSASQGMLDFEAVESSGRHFERYVTQERPSRDELTLVEIPPAYARWLIGEAVVAARAKQQPIPPPFHAFRQVLAPPAEMPPAPVQEAVEESEVRFRPDLVERSVALVERPELATWLPGNEPMAPLVAEWQAIDRGPLTLPPSASAQRRSTILNRVIDLLMGPGGVAGLQRRLQDNALVMLQAGARQEARQLLAAAARLDPQQEASAYGHPLLRALAQRALDAALRGAGARPGAEAGVTGAAPARWDDQGPQPALDLDRGETPFERRPSGLILPR